MTIDWSDRDRSKLVLVSRLQHIEVEFAGSRQVLHVVCVDVEITCQLTEGPGSFSGGIPELIDLETRQ